MTDHAPLPSVGRLHLLLWVGGSQYALPLPSTSRVIPAELLVPVPGAPDFVEGIANVDGRIVTVMAPSMLLGLRAQSAASTTAPVARFVVLLAAREANLGLLSDGPCEIVPDGSFDDVAAPPERLVKRFARRDGLLVRWIDLDGLMERLVEGREG